MPAFGLSLADVHASLERAADVLSTVNARRRGGRQGAPNTLPVFGLTM
jgi:hypothetical protein